MKALSIAATGMMAQELNVEVISNNIANMRTTGFKRSRAEFQDLLYQNLRRPGSSTSDSGSMVPAGVEIGSGVKTTATPRIMSQGSVQGTERELDVAVRGEGFFSITLPDGRTAYTRDGSFQRDGTGTLVNANGYTVGTGIVIPEDSRGVTISSQGEVQAYLGNDVTATTLGTIQLATFTNKVGLEAIGDNLYLETTASGSAQVGTPEDAGYGNLLQAHLEMANVNAVTQISDLIAAQRAYEMNSRVIKAADEMLSSTANLR